MCTYIFIKIPSFIIVVCYDNKFKSVRITTDTLALWTIIGGFKHFFVCLASCFGELKTP